MLHRIRSRLVAERTALINQVRGLLGEYGIVFAQGPSQVRRGLAVLLAEEDSRLSGMARELLADLNGQLRALDERIANYDARVKAACATDERSAKLAELPGIGPLTATALTAAVHDGKAFDNGRQMAASLGLTPREHSSGGKQRLGDGDHQARGHLPAHPPHPRGTHRTAPCRGQDRPALPLGFGRASKARGECRGRGTGHQLARIDNPIICRLMLYKRKPKGRIRPTQSQPKASTSLNHGLRNPTSETTMGRHTGGSTDSRANTILAPMRIHHGTLFLNSFTAPIQSAR